MMEVHSPARAGAVLERLLGAPQSGSAGTPELWMHALRQLVRRRLAAFDRTASDVESGRLARLLARHASRAALARDRDRLALLDRALSFVLTGARPGVLEFLRRALASRNSRQLATGIVGLHDRSGPASVTLLAALIGDGSASALS
jgi:hypothetical protein